MHVLFQVPSISPSFGGPSHTLVSYLVALTVHGTRTTVATCGASASDREWFAVRAPMTMLSATDRARGR
jgi:hypothetical protein